ncbi:MAG: biopolymer transporter ExbD [Bdellovibrionales bacterium]|nr:biopolymer transporter ExbD [Bdellovibrionales bacterium]
MAFSGTPSSTSRGRTQGTLSEINVTPLVDVMLVLLIVFMVSAPLMEQGVTVNLPKANAGSMDEAPEQVILAVDKSRKITVNGQGVAKGMLRERLIGIARQNPGSRYSFRLTPQCPTASSPRSWPR